VTIPERALAGPVKVETAGGSFEISSLPIGLFAFVGLTSISAAAGSGTPANGSLPSANTWQVITLNGYGFHSGSNIIFDGVAEDGTRSKIVVRPTSVANGQQMTVTVPALSVTGPVTVAGSSTSVVLQVVPTLTGISTGSPAAGTQIRLGGTGIPEGGTALGQDVIYTFGASSVTDTDGLTGPDVFSALGNHVHVNLNVPATATGTS